MELQTERLILRPWRASDAELLYEYTKDPLVGCRLVGWYPHTSVENSRQIICNELSANETYAVTFKNDDTAVGNVGLMIGEQSCLNLPAGEIKTQHITRLTKEEWEG